MSVLQNSLDQQRVWAQQQQQQMARLSSLESWKADGVTEAQAQDATTRELIKVKTRTHKMGLKVLAVTSILILLFLYNQVFQNNKRLFWILASFLAVGLLFKFGAMIKEDGGLSFGYY